MEKIQSHFVGQNISSNSAEAFSLFEKSRFGEKSEEKIVYSFAETLFLVEKGTMEIFQGSKKLNKNELMKKLQRFDKRINLKFTVFRDLRKKGYTVKTALKFGADFRVYDKGKKISEDHAKWVVFAEHESGKVSWHEFSAKNRVAHSTRKKLLIAVVDDEEDITYYEVSWVKP
jgi:tRNA-intron endonuclease